MKAPSPQLLAALQKLSKGSDQPAHFELVARWRFACGDAEAGASWQFWSLSPPPIDELRQALAVVWSSFGDFDQAEELLSDAPSWQQLALLLKQTRYDAAEQLQSRLLADPPFVTIPEILAIAADWQKADRPQLILVLFEQLIAYMDRRGEQPTSQFANAFAALLEQLERFTEAAPWWRRSLQLDPNQVWPLMRLAHHQMRCGQPAITEHYCRAVLSLDANHQWAPALQQQALEAMGARGSLALLQQRAMPCSWQRRQALWRQQIELDSIPAERLESLVLRRSVAFVPKEAWQEQTQLGLWGDLDGVALACWAEALRMEPPREPVTLWLLASPDPQLQIHNLELLLQEVDCKVNVRHWPLWDQARHGEIGVLMVAHRAPLPSLLDQQPLALIWQECANPHRWQLLNN